MSKKILIALVVVFFLFAGKNSQAVSDDATKEKCGLPDYKYIFCMNSESKCRTFPKESTTVAGKTPEEICKLGGYELLGCTNGNLSLTQCASASSLSTKSAGCCVYKKNDDTTTCTALKDAYEYNSCNASTMALLFTNLGITGNTQAYRGDCETVSGCPQFTGNPLTTNIQKDLQVSEPVLQIKIPQLKFTDVQNTLDEDGNIHLPWIGELIAALYKFGMAVASIIAVVMIIVQGARIVTSGGGEAKVAAYKRIGQIVVGLSMVWGSYFILYNINPDLVNFKVLKVKYIVRQPLIVSSAEEPATVGTAAPSPGANNVPYFAQWKGPWAEKKPGDPEWPYKDANSDCTSIHRRGCGPTSLAMVMKYYNVDVTPLDTAKWGLACKGAWQPDKTVNSFSTKWPDLKMELYWNTSSDKKKILDLLKQGKPIIYNCAPCVGLNSAGDSKNTATYSGHYVVLTGINGNTISVNDPGANDNRRIRTMTIEEMEKNYKVGIFVHPK